MRKWMRLTMIVAMSSLCLAGRSQAGSLAPEPVAWQNAAQDEGKAAEADKKAKELTLDRLFPERSFWGPSASGMSFSHDGRYAAYLYRPYRERRHGSDLWLLDVETGEVRRITKVSVMAPFQAGTREVKEDRIKKAKEAAKKQQEAGKSTSAPVAETTDDGVSGTWTGLVIGADVFGIPPEGLAFALELELRDGGQVIGVMRLASTTANLSEAAWDAAARTIRGKLIDPQFGTQGVITLTISEEKKITGAIVSEEYGVSLTVNGERTSLLDAAKSDDKGSAEKSDDKGSAEKIDAKIDTETGDWVTDTDGEEQRAPRYVGVTRFEWSPVANELIFTSAGDLYRLEIAEDNLTRLTMTNAFVGGPAYLPDGSGYTYTRNNALMRVRFGSHLLEQIDPRLPSGETMIGYQLSPDGTRAVVVTTRGAAYSSQASTVNIARYRGRFMDVQTVRRHVSDDAMTDNEWNVHLFNINDIERETSELARVFTKKIEGPRDALPTPNWAPDSSRVAFSVFDQKTGLVRILEAIFPPTAEDPKKQPKIEDAKIVYQFFHHGGPNTPRMIQPAYLPDSRHIVFISEQSGFRHLHVLDPLYQTLDQLTTGRYEVYPVSHSKDHRFMFVTATRSGPAQEDVYKVDLVERSMTRLTPIDGDFSGGVAVSEDGAHVLGSFVRYGDLRELVYVNVASQEQKALTDSHPDEARAVTEPMPEFFTYHNRHGHELHGIMFKPDDWTADDKRPLLIYVYGGPLGTRKEVKNGTYSANAYFFAYYMAKKHGYVTCTIDTRGMSGYGGLFEKANFEQIGRPQVEDLVDGAKWFVEHHGVDAKRIGLHGWSFGGFQTQMCLYTEPDVFACGIAGAGPTEWENYNSWYTQGTVGVTRAGAPDLQKFSLLPLAKNLKSRLLLVHGMEDSNVLYQDTVRVYRELLRANKETLVELFLDPTGGHGLGGDVKTLNRFRKYEEFLLRCLGKGEVAAPSAE